MKNTHIPNLYSVVPADIRLQVAIETAEFIRSGVITLLGETCSTSGLCLLFPAIMWGMEEYNFRAPDGRRWHWSETTTAFPELENWLETLVEQSPETRLQWLESYMIPKLKKELGL